MKTNKFWNNYAARQKGAMIMKKSTKERLAIFAMAALVGGYLTTFASGCNLEDERDVAGSTGTGTATRTTTGACGVCAPNTSVGCTCSDGRVGSLACQANCTWAPACVCAGSNVSTGTGTGTGTTPVADGSYACRIVGSNQICCNPAYLGNASSAALLVYEGGTGYDGSVATLGANGYCWSMTTSGPMGFSYGPATCRGLASTSAFNSGKTDCWAQYGPYVGSFAGANRTIIYSAGGGSYGCRVVGNGSYLSPAGNQ